MQVYFVNANIARAVAEVRINGFPIVSSPTGAKRGAFQVNQFVMGGKNRIVVAFEDDATRGPGDAGYPTSDSIVDVEFCECKDVRFPGIGPYQVLATVPGLQPIPLEIAPRRRQVDFQLPVDLPRWIWQDAAPLSLSDATRDEARRFVRRVHEAVENRDVATLAHHARVVFEEVAPAYGRTPKEASDEFGRLYGSLFSSPDFGAAPLLIEDLEFRLCGLDNVLQVTTRSGRAAIRERNFDAQGGGWFLPLFLGRLDGDWAIFRS